MNHTAVSPTSPAHSCHVDGQTEGSLPLLHRPLSTPLEDTSPFAAAPAAAAACPHACRYAAHSRRRTRRFAPAAQRGMCERGVAESPAHTQAAPHGCVRHRDGWADAHADSEGRVAALADAQWQEC
eukprot:6211949-Pleurochrysis_carterae.AAC.2